MQRDTISYSELIQQHKYNECIFYLSCLDNLNLQHYNYLMECNFQTKNYINTLFFCSYLIRNSNFFLNYKIPSYARACLCNLKFDLSMTQKFWFFSSNKIMHLASNIVENFFEDTSEVFRKFDNILCLLNLSNQVKENWKISFNILVDTLINDIYSTRDDVLKTLNDKNNIIFCQGHGNSGCTAIVQYLQNYENVNVIKFEYRHLIEFYNTIKTFSYIDKYKKSVLVYFFKTLFGFYTMNSMWDYKTLYSGQCFFHDDLISTNYSKKIISVIKAISYSFNYYKDHENEDFYIKFIVDTIISSWFKNENSVLNVCYNTIPIDNKFAIFFK